jgi:hypothetical protein
MRKLLLASLSAAALTFFSATPSHAVLSTVGGTAGNTPANNDVLGVTAGLFGAQLSATAGTYEYTFIGKEASFVDHFNTPGGSFNNQTAAAGDTFSVAHGGGLLNFNFFVDDLGLGVTNGLNGLPNGTDPNFFVSAFNGGYYIALDDLGSGPDDNHDDLVVFVKEVAVPEPASLALFGAGLAGLAFIRRRKTA